MSVIASLTATPNRLKIALRSVSSYGSSGIKDDLLQQTLLPAELARGQSGDDEPQGGSAVGDEVVRELRNLGMLVLGDDGSLTVSPGLTRLTEDDFVDYLQEKLLNPAEASKHGQRTLPGALAWFLCQDPATPLSFGYNYKEIVDKDCGPEIASYELINRDRFNQFAYWVRFLGFAWWLDMDRKTVIVPDPTRAIARVFFRWEGKSGWQPIGEVLSRLADDLPVLETGVARNDVESRIAPHKRRTEGHISRSTSFALRRLERGRQIEMQRMADAPAMNLELGPELRPVSHVRVAGTSGG